MELLFHGPVAPEAGGVEIFLIKIHVGNEDAGAVELEAAGDAAVGGDGEAGPLDGRVVLLLALTQKWFSAARHCMVAGTMVRKMLYLESATTLVRALWND